MIDWFDPDTLRVWRRYFANANFDPGTMMMAASAGMTLAGGAVSAMGTLAGGADAQAIARARQQEAEFEATQDVQNSASAIAASGRQAIDINQKASLLQSTARATAAASGVNAGTGSALQNEAAIGARGKYAAAMELWQGQNEANDDLNKAAAKHYEGLVDLAGGEMAKRASIYSAIGTIAGGGGSAFKTYANFGRGIPGAGAPAQS